MSPLRATSVQSFWTLAACLGWVVRMKSSWEMSRRFHTSMKGWAILSTKREGSMPISSAARAIFWPCSSRPVRKSVS
jgi:hypothetical protein